jgi:hypothetical protein
VDTGVKERTAPSPGAGPGPAVDRSRLVLTGLLLVIVIVGVRAGFALTWQGGWRGPWHDRDGGIAMAVALELLCAVLLGALLVRYRRSQDAGDPARKLRIALTLLIVAMMVTLGAALVSLVHFHLTPHKPRNPFVSAGPPRKRVQVLTPHGSGPAANLDIFRDVALAIVVLAVAALLVILLRRRRRRPEPEVVEVVDDSTALRQAVEAGRRALGEVSEPRMAIIRCYQAMEHSLAEVGAARVAAETPDELLARSTGAGLLHGDAPVELTALFYEARFSTHPVPESARARALQAVDTILADLSEARAKGGQAPAGTAAAP